MNRPPLAIKWVWATTGLAALLWFATFYLTFSVFWIKISLSAGALALLALRLQPPHGTLKPGPRILLSDPDRLW